VHRLGSQKSLNPGYAHAQQDSSILRICISLSGYGKWLRAYIFNAEYIYYDFFLQIDIFTQISDPGKNNIIVAKFDSFLKESLVLPKSVFEEPSFGYNEDLAKQCFDLSVQIRLDDFLRVILSDKAPSCFIWINVFHRFTLVQNVVHPISCNVCDRTHFNGFRYKCQKCRKYQMCQDCFWRGRVSNAHHLTHQMKEYTNYVSYLI